MKKMVISIFFFVLLCSGCGEKSLNCSIQYEEDGGLITNEVSYSFSFIGKQKARNESIIVTLDTLEDSISYYENLQKAEQDSILKYSYELDESTFTVISHRDINISNLDDNSKKELTPSTKLKFKNLKSEYEKMGYTCK